ncbi:MAG: TldD/PmbA family protein [Planctomycetaceae bacterium]|nr:TldD/PmbA family protein [Planctomycetaceae bacterium]
MNFNHGERIIELAAKRFDACEVFLTSSRSASVYYENGELEGIEQSGTSGAALRAARGGKLALTTTSRPEDAQPIVNAADALVPFGRPYVFGFAPYAKAKVALRHAAEVADVTPAKLLDIATRAKTAIREALPDALFSGGCAITSGELAILTSAGQHCREPFTAMNAAFSASYNTEGDFLQVGASIGTTGIVSDRDVDDLIATAVDDFRSARTTRQIESGQYRVLFTPEAVSDLLKPVLSSINGSNVEKGVSRWKDSIGKRVLDPRVSIIDDPADPRGISSSTFDGEGTPTQVRRLIDAGTLTGFVHTRATAAATKMEPTGNGSRSINTSPSPRTHNLIMEGGSDSVSKLTRDAEGGLIVSRLLGTFTSNFLAGQVSGNISLGYPVKGGERTGRVKNAALNVNIFEMFQPGRLIGISKERRWVGGEYLPWLLIDGVVISAR